MAEARITFDDGSEAIVIITSFRTHGDISHTEAIERGRRDITRVVFDGMILPVPEERRQVEPARQHALSVIDRLLADEFADIE